ncbi:MAG: hypothetical protein LRS49_06040 [Desulfurococcales archaeon]|nr:hypothetical protein [Desulfurococcales archaeon]
MLILALVATVGVAVYLSAVSSNERIWQAAEERVRKEEVEALAAPAIYYAYIRNSTGELWVILATGPLGVDVYAVYLDGRQLEPANFTLPLHVPPNTVEAIGPFRAEAPESIVSVSTSAGDVDAPVDLLP